MATIKDFEDLEIWKTARLLCNEIHALTESENFKKDWGLKHQMLNSSGSVMDNIAEGFERNGNKEFIQALFIAKGSLGELRSQLIRSADKKYISDEELNSFREKIKNLGGKIWNFITYLKSSEMTGIKFAKEKTETTNKQ
jgi:four helix bundle protein